MSEHAWLEPIQTAAVAIAADPPPLTEWEAGEDGESEVIDGTVENLLQELGWPTRTRTFTFDASPFGSDSDATVTHESTSRYFPLTWLVALTDRVADHVRSRDAGRAPPVPDRLRLRNLPLSANYDAVRPLIEAAWDYAGEELACSIAVMYPDEAMSLDGLRYNLAVRLCYAPEPGVDLSHILSEPVGAEPPPPVPATYGGRLAADEDDLFPTLRNLPSPKWRGWFSDTLTDRAAVHDTLARCGVDVTEQLDVDLQRARYAIDADATHMTIEELVDRVEARHRLFVSAVRAARDSRLKDDPPGGNSGRAGFGPRRRSSRPAAWDAIMEMVGRLKGENVRWKEIREKVEQAHGYRCDSEEALRKNFDRWQKSRRPAV